MSFRRQLSNEWCDLKISVLVHLCQEKKELQLDQRVPICEVMCPNLNCNTNLMWDSYNFLYFR